MPAKHPYTGVTGSIGQIISQLRKQFPATVDASTLKKYSIAPNNESYLINILRFLGVIDESGQRTEGAKAAFLSHDNEKFQAGFADLIKGAYVDLFDLYGDDAWDAQLDKLIAFFRQTDETSDVIGTRQARTFTSLAAAAGKREPLTAGTKKTSPTPKSAASKAANSPKAPKPAPKGQVKSNLPPDPPAGTGTPGVAALTVRIEVNLPAGADQETYDAIFKSIRANLMQ